MSNAFMSSSQKLFLRPGGKKNGLLNSQRDVPQHSKKVAFVMEPNFNDLGLRFIIKVTGAVSYGDWVRQQLCLKV